MGCDTIELNLLVKPKIARNQRFVPGLPLISLKFGAFGENLARRALYVDLAPDVHIHFMI